MQRNGCIGLLTNGMSTHAMSGYDNKFDRMVYQDGEVLPVRAECIHHFVTNELMKLIVETALYAMGSKLRARYCQHDGPFEKTLIELEKYGIDADIVPMELGGSLEFDYANHLVERRAAVEG